MPGRAEGVAEVVERGYEGLMARDPASAYVSGRTLKWLKVKQPKYREEERGFYKPHLALPRKTHRLRTVSKRGPSMRTGSGHGPSRIRITRALGIAFFGGDTKESESEEGD